jgi:hypothetical protein
LCSVRKPNSLEFSKCLSLVCFWILLKINFSNSLPVVDKRLIGRKFGFLPSFGRVMIFVSFQGAGKWLSRKQWLNKCVKCTRGLLGKCRRRSRIRKLIVQCGNQAGLRLEPPRVVCGHSHTSHALWTVFLNSLWLYWLYWLDKIWDLMNHELQMVPLVHNFLLWILQ